MLFIFGVVFEASADARLNGRWVCEEGAEWFFNNGIFEAGSGGTVFIRGVYSVSGNNITLIQTHWFAENFNIFTGMTLPARVMERSELEAAAIAELRRFGRSAADARRMFLEAFNCCCHHYFPLTSTFAIGGNILAIPGLAELGGVTLTRR